MRDILAGLPRIAGSDFVFTTTGTTSISGYSRAKNNLDQAITRLNGGAPIPCWVVHDIRRSGATAMARLSVQLPVVERLLNHTSGVSFGGVAGVYQRHTFRDEMTEALECWGRHIGTLTARAPKPNSRRITVRSARPEKGRRQGQSGLGVRP
jgi:integrase